MATRSNRTGTLPASGSRSAASVNDRACQLCTVTAATGDGSYVTLVQPPGQGSFQHAPTWQARDGQGLFYAATNGCQPGPACAGEIWYVAQADGTTSPDLVETGRRGIRDLDADPQEANRLLVVDDRGASLLFDHQAKLLADSATIMTASFTPDGNRIVGIANGDTLKIWDRDANLIADPTITELLTAYVAEGQGTVGLVVNQATARSVSPWVDPSSGPQTDVVLLLDDDDDTTLPAIAVTRIDWQGSQARITELRTVPFSIANENQILAVAQ